MDRLPEIDGYLGCNLTIKNSNGPLAGFGGPRLY